MIDDDVVVVINSIVARAETKPHPYCLRAALPYMITRYFATGTKEDDTIDGLCDNGGGSICMKLYNMIHRPGIDQPGIYILRVQPPFSKEEDRNAPFAITIRK